MKIKYSKILFIINSLFFFYKNYKYSNKKIDINWKKQKYNRVDVINKIVKDNNFKSYLEIGCDNDEVFKNIHIEEKIGVDPIRGGNIRSTSDDFFSNNFKKFDLIFIDGLHTYKQSRKDFINSNKFLNDGGIICFHDVIPLNWKEEHTPRVNNVWTGDVWKLAFELSITPDLSSYVIKLDHGIGIYRKNNACKLLNQNYLYISNKNFDFYYNIFNQFKFLDWDNLDQAYL